MALSAQLLVGLAAAAASAPPMKTSYPIYMIGSSNMHHCINKVI